MYAATFSGRTSTRARTKRLWIRNGNADSCGWMAKVAAFTIHETRQPMGQEMGFNSPLSDFPRSAISICDIVNDPLQESVLIKVRNITGGSPAKQNHAS